MRPPTLAVRQEAAPTGRGWGMNNSWWLTLVSLVVAGMCIEITRWIGNPKSWDCVHSFLDAVHKYIFTEQKYPTPPYHRVTLFKARCFRAWWDIRGLICQATRMKPRWLVAVVRSGQSDQGAITWFKIGDRESDCSGVCGRAWYCGGQVSVWDLPQLTVNTTVSDLEEYARKSNVSMEKLQKHLPTARSILALRIQTNGNRWGVLVFDSRRPEKIDHTQVDAFCSLLAGHMSNLAEKIL